MVKRFGLGKEERLKSRKQIDVLFKEGKTINVFPLRAIFCIQRMEAGTALQAGFTVSKRFFKKAVDRNRIKRLMREAYRLQKNELLQILIDNHVGVYVFFVFTDKTLPNFKSVSEAVQNCIHRLQKIVANEACT